MKQPGCLFQVLPGPCSEKSQNRPDAQLRRAKRVRLVCFELLLRIRFVVRQRHLLSSPSTRLLQSLGLTIASINRRRQQSPGSLHGIVKWRAFLASRSSAPSAPVSGSDARSGGVRGNSLSWLTGLPLDVLSLSRPRPPTHPTTKALLLRTARQMCLIPANIPTSPAVCFLLTACSPYPSSRSLRHLCSRPIPLPSTASVWLGRPVSSLNRYASRASASSSVHVQSEDQLFSNLCLSCCQVRRMIFDFSNGRWLDDVVATVFGDLTVVGANAHTSPEYESRGQAAGVEGQGDTEPPCRRSAPRG